MITTQATRAGGMARVACYSLQWREARADYGMQSFCPA
jgi:hypothetical protein